MSIKENITIIREQIAQAAILAGRKPEDILLCAATKMNSAANIREAIASGVNCCGENRVQELISKLSENAYTGAPVHFIGHLQTNKVRQVVGKVALIQSVDSRRLLSAINKEASSQGICQDVLLEINLINEESKSGFSVPEMDMLLPDIGSFSNIRVKGLMAIPPNFYNSTENYKFFQKMYNLSVDIMAKKYDNVCVDILSLGMSGDFREAIACGSTMVRIGSAIFGERDYAASP